MKKIKNITLFMIIFAIALTSYFTVIVLKYPLVGIEVKKDKNLWIVEKIHENGWASSQPIEIGDIVEFVNGKSPEKHLPVAKFNRVEMAESITISNKDTFSVLYTQLDPQYVFYLLLPFLFSMATIFFSIFLYQKKREERLVIILIYFLLSLGLGYLSGSVSARGESIGTLVNTITFPSTLILFSHFLKDYLSRYQFDFIKTKTLAILYILNFSVFLLMVVCIAFWNVNKYIVTTELLFFLLLICFVVYLLIRFYIKHKNSERNDVLVILSYTLFASVSPSLLFYIIPKIFFQKKLISAEFTVVFLMIIPIVFAYLILTEKFFDLEYLMNRLRYYSLLSFPFTAFISFLLSFILNLELLSGFTLFLVLFIFTVLFLYGKEYLDYKFRRHLFSQKNNFEASLHTFFQKTKYETKVSSLMTIIINEVKSVLMVKDVFNMEVCLNNQRDWVLKNKRKNLRPYIAEIEKVDWRYFPVGSIVEVPDGFVIVIEGDKRYKNIIFCVMERTLNIQEKIWLETLAHFSSILLENTRLIAGLAKEIETLKEKNETAKDNYPCWLSKVLLALSEKERTNLSIDLHDTILQEQLQLLRDTDKIIEKAKDTTITPDLEQLKEKILDNIHLLRETCNQLRPPFLSELGVIQAIQDLIDQTRLRCDFILRSDLDPSIQRLDHEIEITLYRIVQELLNNAIKHSSATEVEISLFKNDQSLFLTYFDNGKGINMQKLNDSFKNMGIFGIKERVKNLGGTVEIESAPGKGTQIFIQIGGIKFD